MSQVQSGSSEAAAAALVGSLSTFSLVDILDLLARTGHTGELQVVGRGVDQRVWVDRGDVIDTNDANSFESVLFELACIEEGWFYFTAAASAPEGRQRVSVTSMLADLGPQVEEWRELVEILPFESVVCMSASTPAPEVQIRADQWLLLSLVGNPGRPVRAVVEASELHPLDTLRTLRELTNAGLISVEEDDGSAAAAPIAAPAIATPPTAGSPATDTGDTVEATTASPSDAPPDDDAAPGSDAPTERWTLPVSEDDEGSDAHAPEAQAESSDLPPFVPPLAATGSVPPPAPEGWVEREEVRNGSSRFEPSLSESEAAMALQSEALVEVPTSDGAPVAQAVPSTVMPPPITGDPWSSSLTSDQGSEEA
jgi:hypothetical protein